MSLSPTQFNILTTLYPDKTLPSQVHTGDISVLQIKGLIDIVGQCVVLTEKGKVVVETITSIRASYTNKDKLGIKTKERVK